MFSRKLRSLALLMLCLLTTTPWAAASNAPATQPRPNVLMIAIDDLNDWVGCLQGHPHANTPHIDALARRGTLFHNAHCQSPLCNPSRTSLLLGVRPTTTGIYGLAPAFQELPEWRSRVPMAQHFSRNGYRTYCTGKIFHSIPPKNRPQEFDVYGPHASVGVRPKQKLIPPTPMGNHPLMDWGVVPPSKTPVGDAALTNWAIAQLKQHAGDQPFFLSIGYFLPHVPCYTTQEWFTPFEKLPRDQLLPPVLADDRADTPRFSWYLHWSLPEPRLRWLEQEKQWENLVRSYLACISFVDDQVGRLLRGLDESGKRDQTIVLLWSDHGWHLGEKGISGKNTLWERSTHVPLIFAGPGITTQGHCPRPVELLDIYPTLIDLCTLPKRQDLEGVSLQPLLQDPNSPRNRPAITSHNQGNHAVRTEDWRYIHYADGSEELYNRRTDPHEWRNLAADPQHSPVIADLRRWLPTVDRPAAPGSAHRILTYDRSSGEITWEGAQVRPTDPIPE